MNEYASIIPNIRKETKKVTIHFELNKDLQEDEIICEHCKGTGLEIADNIYGIKGDTTHIGIHFPYKKQSISFCKYCYNGVLKKCEFCGSILTKNHYTCCCKEKKNQPWNKIKQKELDRWSNVKKGKYEGINDKYTKYIYVENFDKYFDDLDELEEFIYDIEFDDKEKFDRTQLRIYATNPMELSIDAVGIIEFACEDHYEDASDNCDEDSLQKLLDDWCEQQGIISYEPKYDIGILID